MAALQSAGIAAGVVQDIEDLMERDPQLSARGSLIPLEHAVLGTFGHMRTPMTLSRGQLQPYRAPNIGEHSGSIAAPDLRTRGGANRGVGVAGSVSMSADASRSRKDLKCTAAALSYQTAIRRGT